MGRAGLIAAAAQTACLMEVMAPKPGNVSRGRDLPGLTYRDFVLSACAIGPVFHRQARGRVGRLILEAVRRTRRQVRTNANLGIILLLAPLARAAMERRGPFRDRLRRLLLALDVQDARDAYRAIRLADAGGLGRVEEQDVRSAPTVPLLECMRLAAERDAIAREYATGFELSLTAGLPALRRLRDRHTPLPVAISQAYLILLAANPDTLVARRHGWAAARAVRRRACRILRAGGFLTEGGRAMAERLDRDLRAARPPKNPGATADLTVASLFLWLLDDQGLLGGIGAGSAPTSRPRALRRRPRGSSRARRTPSRRDSPVAPRRAGASLPPRRRRKRTRPAPRRTARRRGRRRP
jgi:triphosphoribosyl-dephospho-CoA synthase